jgi:carbamoyl-phosphate synthase large subunit
MGIDRSYRPALVKALIAAKAMLPSEGNLLVSIADRDKREAAPLLERLARLGYGFYATAGTARLLGDLGIPVEGVARKLQEGHPHVVDAIEAGRVKGIVNTVTGVRTPTQDGYADGFYIRRAATERGLATFTSLDTLRVAVDSVAPSGEGYDVAPLADYVAGRASSVEAPEARAR